MPISRTEIILVLSFLTLFILVMVSFIIIILFFIQKKQRGFTSEILAVKENHEKELYKAQLEIQEQTFKEISREIHDNVGQILSLAKLGLGTLDLDRKSEARESLIEISDIIEKALDDLRHMSRSLNAEIIINGGLKKSIEMQVGYLQRGGKFNIHYHVTGDPVYLDETKEIILFRIAQEAVNNVIRHSKASDVYVSLLYSQKSLVMQIKDNGKGFNMSGKESESNPISGIYNMQHRARLINAEFRLESQVGNGTSIFVTTPVY